MLLLVLFYRISVNMDKRFAILSECVLSVLIFYFFVLSCLSTCTLLKWKININFLFTPGYRGSNPAGQYPEIRGQGYVEPDPISVGGGPPQSRIFRNTQQQLPQNQYVTPSYPPSQYQNQDLGYSFQNINGQYINTGKK